MIVPVCMLSSGVPVEARIGADMLTSRLWACRRGVSAPAHAVRSVHSNTESTPKPAANKQRLRYKKKPPPPPADLPPPLIEIKEGTFYRTYPTANPNTKTPPLFKKFDFSLSARTPQVLTPPDHGRSRDKTRIDSRNKRFQKQIAVEENIRRFYGPLHWAVMGPGSTDFLDVLRGQYIAVPPTSRSYPYLSSDQFSPSDPKLRLPTNAIQYVGFRGEGSQATGGTRGAYLSARYESLHEETDWTVRQYLCNRMELNPLEEDSQASRNPYSPQLWDSIVQSFQLSNLLDMPTAKLSNGQTRRTRIAKALLSQPELLLLDHPFMGLDPMTSESISSLLREVAYKASPRVIMALRNQDSIPEWVSHIAIVNTDTVPFLGPKEDFFQTVELIYRDELPFKKEVMALKPLFQEGAALHGYRDVLASNYPDYFKSDQSLLDRPVSKQKEAASKPTAPLLMDGEPQIEMNGVRVQYGDKVVLGNWTQTENAEPGLHWKVRRGQRWAILGANGSGKTTLLSLITSDHPQAYALPIRLFGRSRLPEPPRPGISVFDLQARIGHSSPEIQAFFPSHLTVREAIESAWADAPLSKPKLTFKVDTLIDRVLAHFRPELATSQQLKASIEDRIDMSVIPEGFQERFAAPDRRSAGSSDEAGRFPDHNANNQNTNATVGFDSYAYADEITFGELELAQQRLVLFIRAIIKKQELIVLDEAFAAMPPSMRQKCFALLEGPPENQTTGDEKLPYVDNTQSVIFISHLREEIPDSVRFWMRLPSQVGDDQRLDFAMGVLPDGETLASNKKLWDNIWSKNSFQPYENKLPSKGGVSSPSDAEMYGYVLAEAKN